MSEINLPSSFEGVHFHFVGIKGTGMVALVEILHARGAVITGSDVSERFYTDEILEHLGICALSFSEKNITDSVQFVIYSSAYSVEKNPDLIEAKKRGLPMMLYSEALGAVSAASYSCGVCGVHGKTTTTGLCGTLLKELPLESQVLAGSIIKSFGDSCVMTKGHEYFVAETCEYQRHFMAFHPKKIILTSVESDHQDYYPTYEDIRDAFVDYICKLSEGGQVIYCADDKGACEAVELAKTKRSDIQAIPYGEKAFGDYRLAFGRVEGGVHYFTVSSLDECAICVPGDHNVRNATAALALCAELLKSDGKNPLDFIEDLKRGLKNFAGGKRRSEIVGRAKTPLGQDVIFIDDYGHHPTAIKTTLAGFREFYKNHKIIVDFMSHTYTRTAALLEEFASSFDSADKVIINKIYGSAREDAGAANVTGEILSEHAKKYHKDIYYAGEFDEASEMGLKFLSEPSGKDFPDGYVFVTMGAGDNWKVGKKILEKLS
ncbi:UDP-N-acetylmuramate--L-alanine ligase [Treponema sp.]|uniref:UDP-N-acetylmuramate--L-alanine ligase n=1 Tax=Treponema sp. TaxID=166 RepID=UPI003890409D